MGEEVLANSEAENLCTDWHSSTLFMPDSQEEISFIGDFLKGRKAWLGANDLAEEGVIVWADGKFSISILKEYFFGNMFWWYFSLPIFFKLLLMLTQRNGINGSRSRQWPLLLLLFCEDA